MFTDGVCHQHGAIFDLCQECREAYQKQQAKRWLDKQHNIAAAYRRKVVVEFGTAPLTQPAAQ